MKFVYTLLPNETQTNALSTANSTRSSLVPSTLFPAWTACSITWNFSPCGYCKQSVLGKSELGTRLRNYGGTHDGLGAVVASGHGQPSIDTAYHRDQEHLQYKGFCIYLRALQPKPGLTFFVSCSTFLTTVLYMLKANPFVVDTAMFFSQ